MKLLMKIGTAIDRVIDILATVVIILIVFSLVFICFGVVMRYFLHRPQGWVVQFVGYSIVFMTFLGAPWILRADKHAKMDILVNYLKPRKQAMLDFATSILGAIICLIIVVYGTEVTVDFFQRNVWVADVIELPEGPLFAIIPFCFCFLFLQFLGKAHRHLERWKASPK